MKKRSSFLFGLMSFWSGLLFAGCQQAHSALAPVTPEASRIANIWWVFLSVCAAVYVVIVLLVGWLIIKRPKETHSAGVLPTTGAAMDGAVHRLIAGATVLTTAILFSLLVSDFWVQRRLPEKANKPVVIRLVGHQWWWEAEYQNENASEVFSTANELHVPVGRQIRLILESNDVIHSFWIPQLHGKKDLVPGHPATLDFTVNSMGKFEGQCAEFCGLQHAHMSIVVYAESPEKYESWATTQRSEAPPSTDETQIQGRHLFEHTSCAMCHTVAGTTAQSRVGPPLTHFASRATLGAGAVPNTRESLARWISDPNIFKPGVQMPPNHYSPEDLDALLDFLETLK